MNTPTRLVIFDLDGTLLNTIGDLAAGCNYVLRRQGYPQHSLDAYRLMVGNGITKLVERALPAEARTPDRIAALRADFIDYYQRHIDELTHPYAGIPELLAELEGRGLLLAVASNKFQIGTRHLIARFFPERHFSAVYGQRDGVPVKPDPAIVENILADTAIGRDETLYVGDSAVDMHTAAAAGIASVGALWGFRSRTELEKAGADHLVCTPSDILHFTETLHVPR